MTKTSALEGFASISSLHSALDKMDIKVKAHLASLKDEALKLDKFSKKNLYANNANANMSTGANAGTVGDGAGPNLSSIVAVSEDGGGVDAEEEGEVNDV